MAGQSLDALKQSEASLVDALQQAGALVRGRTVRCPFCNDHHPSGGIYQTDGGVYRYKCQKCGFSGSIVDVLAKREGIESREVLRRFVGKPVQSPKKVYDTIDDLQAAMPGTVEAVYEYQNQASGKADMVVLRAKDDQGKTFRQASPVPSGGYVFEAPRKPWPLYNCGDVAAADTVVVVEGEKCVEACREFGVVATTSPGGAKNANNADWSLLAGKNIVLWPDSDGPGRQYVEDVKNCLERLEPAPRLAFIEPNELDLIEGEDVADYVSQLKITCDNPLEIRAELAKALSRAKPRGPVSALGQEIDRIIAGERRIIQTPWDNLDHLARPLLPGTVCVLAGNPSASKSFLVLQILSHALDNGIPATAFELEESREHYLFRLLAQKSGDARMTNSEWIEANPELARKAQTQWADWLENIGKSIHICQNAGITLSQLATWIEGRAKAGKKLIIVDPLTAADHSQRETWAEDAEFILQTKRIAVEHNTSILLVSHPVKAVSHPELGQLSGGAAFGRFVQSILWLEAHDYKSGPVLTPCGTADQNYNRTLHVIKARNAKGSGCKIAMTFRSDSLTFCEHGMVVRGGDYREKESE